MKRLGIIFGGKSGEHEISLMSAASVARALENSEYQTILFGISKSGEWYLYEGSPEGIEDGSWEKEGKQISIGSIKQIVDIVFPVLHGPYGEDGTIQGMLEIIDVPYCGCGVLASSIAMDKIVSKGLFEKAGLPVCKYTYTVKEMLKSEDLIKAEIKRIEDTVPYPMFVKPANMGSSVGITKAKNNEELRKALFTAMKHDRRIIIEEGIACREIDAVVIGNFESRVLVIGEILPSQEFYDYKAKYFDDGKSRMCIPAEIEEEIASEVKRLSLRAYDIIDGSGFSRIDFFLEKETNKIYINEINTIPGFTRFSMFPSLWKATGLSYPELIERIVNLGYERYNAKNNR